MELLVVISIIATLAGVGIPVIMSKVKDGNKLNPKLSQPGYGKKWYKKIAEDTGEKLKVIESPKH